MEFSEMELANICKNSAGHIRDELLENFQQKKWDSLLIADSYSRFADSLYETVSPHVYQKIKRKAERVRGCGAYLQFRVDTKNLDAGGHQRLYRAYFCGDKLCPICQSRRARKIRNQLTAILDSIGGGYRFIFLTLTVKNVGAEGLYPAVDKMLREAWHGLINNRRFKKSVQGYYRTFEITHDVEPLITEKMYCQKKGHYDRHGLKTGDDNPSYDTYHPHNHVLIAVKPSYFDKGSDEYIGQAEWREMWQRALNSNYDPYVYVQAVYDKTYGEKGGKDRISNISAVLEAAKYTTKSNDCIMRGTDNKVNEENTDRAVYAISASLKHRRLISYGGVFREAHKALNFDSVDDGDLLHTEVGADAEMGSDGMVAFDCVWKGSGGYEVISLTCNRGLHLKHIFIRD